jgi:hypothetical protein
MVRIVSGFPYAKLAPRSSDFAIRYSLFGRSHKQGGHLRYAQA